MNVELAQAAKVAAPKTASTAAASRAMASNGSLFSSHLTAAGAKATASSAASGSTSTKTPKGEQTEAVKDHSYSEVIAGPRNGMFINHSGNAREGQAFARVRRDGREFHIYGSGKNRVIVEVKHKPKTPEPTVNTPTPTDNSTSGSTGSSGSTTPQSPATDTTGAPAT